MTDEVARGGKRPLAVITDDRFGDSEIERALLDAAGVELRVAKCRSSAEVAQEGREAEALLVNMAPVDSAAVEALKRCRVIARYGVGLDNVDVEAARRRGITVANVPGYCDIEVAEHALALLLSSARGVALRDGGVRQGRWNMTPTAGRRIRGTVLGILGFGGTGKALARAALGLGFSSILVWSPHISSERIAEALGSAPESLGVELRLAGLDELLSQSDWVCVHLPLKPQTRGFIGERELGLMKKDAVLINVSRGAIVDEEALAAALSSGKLRGAGLDVFVVEPLPSGSKLRSLPGVTLTDHAAYASRESLVELRQRTAGNAIAALREAGVIS